MLEWIDRSIVSFQEWRLRSLKARLEKKFSQWLREPNLRKRRRLEKEIAELESRVGNLNDQLGGSPRHA